MTINSYTEVTYVDRVPESMPLYDILNEFQKGHSHMAVVVRRCDKTNQQSSQNNANGKNMLSTVLNFETEIFFINKMLRVSLASEIDSVRDVKVDIDGEKPPKEKALKPKMPLHKWKSFPNTNKSSNRGSRSRKWSKNMYSDILEIDGSPLPKLPEEEEAVGIITMEDVIEELLQVLNYL